MFCVQYKIRIVFRYRYSQLYCKTLSCIVKRPQDIPRNAAHWFYIASKLLFTTTWQAVYKKAANCNFIPRWWNKIPKKESLTNEHQCTWFTKFNYLEKRKLKSRENKCEVVNVGSEPEQWTVTSIFSSPLVSWFAKNATFELQATPLSNLRLWIRNVFVSRKCTIW